MAVKRYSKSNNLFNLTKSSTVSISFEITGSISTKDLLHEVIIMTRLHHENVIRLHGIVLDSNAIMLVRLFNDLVKK